MPTDRRIARLIPALHEVAGPVEKPADCPECRSAGSVFRDVCEICFAEFDEVAPAEIALAT